MNIENIMSDPVITAEKDAPMSRIINKMVNKKIGSVVLLDNDGTLWGIITESDIVKALEAHSNDENLTWLWSMPVHQVVNEHLITVTVNQKCADVIQLMAANRIRRLPVMDEEDEELLGIVTERDILAAMANASAVKSKIN